MKKVKSVGAYITAAPPAARGKLRQIRAAIKKAAPQALEKISYGMPYYHYKGRLAYFASARTHLGLYIPPPILQNYKRELKAYSTSTSATVRFPLDKKLPLTLIGKLVKARAKYNEVKTKIRNV
jgi:uncharacterized protein YdhG (YjbR/CyaY superfamily)